MKKYSYTIKRLLKNFKSLRKYKIKQYRCYFLIGGKR